MLLSIIKRLKIQSQTLVLIATMTLSLVLTYVVFVVISFNIIFGYTFLAVMSLFLLFSKSYLFLLYFFLWIVFFQNALIAYVSDFILEKHTFSTLHGTNFFLTVVVFCGASILDHKNLVRSKLFLYTLLIILVLIIYTVYGFYFYGAKNAFVYFRLFSMFFFMFWVGCYFAKKLSERPLMLLLKTIFFLTLFSIFGQFFFTDLFNYLMNDFSYYALKADVGSSGDITDIFYSNSYFNISSLGPAMRAPGLIKSFISSAYFIITLSLILYWKKNPFICVCTFFFMIAFIASKGAFLCFLFFVILYFLTKYVKLTVQAALVILSILWTPIIIYGYISFNEHLLGFVSGAKYLGTLGNGLGFSGNLSDIRLISVAGEKLPDLGYWTRFYNGSESALGVLFSSLGLMAIPYLIITYNLIFRTYSLLKNGNNGYLALLSILMLFQGIFQEEAFSPYAFGLVMFVAGFYYKNSQNEIIANAN